MKYIKFRTERGCAVSAIKHIDINDNYPTHELYNVVVHCELGYTVYIEGDSRLKFLKDFRTMPNIVDVTKLDNVSVTRCGGDINVG